MTDQAALADRFRRLATALANTENQPGGEARADGVRTRLVAHIDAIITGLAGKAEACREHPQFPAHNCGCCRSMRIGVDS